MSFWGHFGAKEDFVAQSPISCLDDFQETLLKKFGDKSMDLREVVRDYLSMKRRDHPEAGCPTAALAGELPEHH